MRLREKVAIVTGAASGIGAATARKMAEEGARVLLVDRDDERGEGVAAAIRARGGTAEFLRDDMGELDAMEAIADKPRSPARRHFNRPSLPRPRPKRPMRCSRHLVQFLDQGLNCLRRPARAPIELPVDPGAIHGFGLAPGSWIETDSRRDLADALRRFIAVPARKTAP